MMEQRKTLATYGALEVFILSVMGLVNFQSDRCQKFLVAVWQVATEKFLVFWDPLSVRYPFLFFKNVTSCHVVFQWERLRSFVIAFGTLERFRPCVSVQVPFIIELDFRVVGTLKATPFFVGIRLHLQKKCSFVWKWTYSLMSKIQCFFIIIYFITTKRLQNFSH